MFYLCAVGALENRSLLDENLRRDYLVIQRNLYYIKERVSSIDSLKCSVHAAVDNIYRLFNVNKKKWRPMGHFPNQPKMANYAP